MKEYKILGFPVKTFDPEKLQEEMVKATDGTMFLLAENRIKNHEGDDSVELIFAKIVRAKS